MKKTLALILMLAAMLACTTAFAGELDPNATKGTGDASVAPVVSSDMTSGMIVDDNTDGVEPVVFTVKHNGADYDWATYTFAEGKWEKVGGETGNTEDADIYALSAMNPKYNVESGSDKTPMNGELTHWLVITYEDADGNQVQEGYQFYVDWFNYQHEWFGYSVQSFSQLTLPCWYPDNTANAFGPRVDGSWQTYAAVDLSVQGTQEIDLIAAGAWKIGSVLVNVDGDTLTVSYQMAEDVNTRDTWDDITVDSEYLNIFGDAASIDLKAESAFTFGDPISISGDLGGDTTVCVVVSNKVDFPAHSPYVTRFWPNMPENKAVVEVMNAILAD